MKNISIGIVIGSIFTFMLMTITVFMMEKGEAEIVIGDANGINPGIIESYSGSSVPDGYLFCNGQAVSRTTYSDLFAVIGTTYGSGDGSTTFNLPNLNGRSIVGKDSSNFTTLGATGGSINTTLTTANIPSHSHTVTAKGSVSSTFTGSSATTNSTGSHTHAFRMGDADGSTASGAAGVVANRSGTLLALKSFSKFKTHATANQSAGAHTHTVTAKGTVSSTFTGSSATTSSVGSGTAFTNMQPYIVTNYIIKY